MELPEGWSRNYSKTNKCYYYFNEHENISQWHAPTEDSKKRKRILTEKSESMTPKAAKISQQPNVAIIVPFQDLHEAQKRSAHMKMFVPHMEKYLKDTGLNNYHVYIVEQSEDGKKFNRGKLLNIGYDIAKQDYNVYIFHDVDLLPGVR